MNKARELADNIDMYLISLGETPTGEQYEYLRSAAQTIRDLIEENERLNNSDYISTERALELINAAINKPKGVVPHAVADFFEAIKEPNNE